MGAVQEGRLRKSVSEERRVFDQMLWTILARTESREDLELAGEQHDH